MAHKVVIEVETRFTDGISGESRKASRSVEQIGDAAQEAQRDVKKLGQQKAKPVFDADNNRFLKKIRAAEERANKFGKTKKAAILQAVDKTTTTVGKILNKLQKFGNSVWSAILKVKDSQAVDALRKITGAAKTIAGKTWSAIVKIKDYATAPLRKIRESLFSIKSLIAAVTAGVAAKTLVANPISLSDSIESSRIAFETKLGSAEAAEEFLQSIYKFDEKSPFDTIKIVGITQQMMNMGWTAENVLTDLERIGDWASGVGKGEEGISAVTRALGQMRQKGKLSSEEMLQLTEAGVSAWDYLAKHMGLSVAEVRELAEDGAIDVNTAIEGILSGLEEYAGSAAMNADRTVSGIVDQMKSLLQTNIMLPWGDGLAKGLKRGLTRVKKLLEDNKDTLKSWGNFVEEIGTNVSEWVADVMENTVDRLESVTGSDAFKNASFTGKLKLIWDGVIKNPLADWWSDTVVPWWDQTAMPWLAEKAAGMGEALGSGLTNGITTLLGIDATGAMEDGVTIGGSFMEGFLEGFDTDKIGEALKTWVEDNKGLAAGLGTILGIKFFGWLGNAIGGIKTLFGGGGGSGGTTTIGDIGSSYAGTMDVTAGVVNVYGNNGFGNNTPNFGGGTGGGGTGTLMLPNGTPSLPSGGGQLALPSGAGAAKTGLWQSIKGFFAGTPGSYTGVALGNGTIAGTSSPFVASLAKLGVSLGSGASTAGGAAAVGAGSVAGIIGGILGLGSAGIDLFQGIKASRNGDSAAAKDEYWSAGTKTGMVGAGAGIGAGIGALFGGVGAVPGALIGAGVGGVAAMFSGSKVGNWLSEASDEGGWLNNAGKSIKEFFTTTLPDAWNSMWDGVSNFVTETIPNAWENLTEKVSTFFTETIPEKWNEFWEGVGNFFTETVPNAWETLTEKVSTFFTETIPEAWNSFWEGVGNFFFETVPYALGYAIGKAEIFFTETIPEAWNTLWDGITTFFTETIPEWASNIWDNHIWPFLEKVGGFFALAFGAIVTFFTETIPEWATTLWEDCIVPFFTVKVPLFFSTLWDTLVTFFTETLPEWAENVWNNHIVPFFTETIPNWFSNLWTNIATFFTETLPEWAANVWNNKIVPFFTETIPGWFGSLWVSLVTFATETVPAWASNIWNNKVVPFFNETIPDWFSSLWSSLGAFFTETLPSIASTIWGGIKSFFTETIPSWFSTVWNRVKGSFSAGYGDSGAGGGGRARGGIVGGSSAMEAFARGGIVGGSTRFIRVNEESPEMIIPLSSQRRDRAMKLWGKTGSLLGVPGFARGGRTDGGDEGYHFPGFGDHDTGGQSVIVEVGGINVEIHVHTTGAENIAEAIRAQSAEIAEAVAGIFVDSFGTQFENTPVRGGA